MLFLEGTEPFQIYNKLNAHFGFLNWWPGDTKFEIFVGAILTQQTTWKNVEKAIANLKDSNSLSIEKISSMELPKLEKLIRPSGFYRQKARRLKTICKTILKEHGTFENLLAIRKDKLRETLLSYKGIGKETADSIILYAAGKPIFVIDAYTRKSMNRINPLINWDIEYDELRDYFERRLKKDLNLYQDFHAQFVELGKNYCKNKPLCSACPLKQMCSYSVFKKP